MSPDGRADQAPSGADRARGALDASMTLLNEVTRKPLDPGYRLAAERRALEGSRPHTARRTALVLLSAMVLGLGITAATLSLRAPQPSVMAARLLLEEQIRDRTADVELLRDRAQALNADIDQLHASALAASNSALVEQLEADSIASGATAVTGPGLRITLTDPPVTEGGVEDPEARVIYSDLQMIVNGLWQAGAEAVSVNDQRLTATTSIRSAGSAILVDLVPIIGPYTIEAIGDRQGLQTGLARSRAGDYMTWLRNSAGVGVDTSSQPALELPSAARVTLHSATVPASTPLVAPHRRSVAGAVHRPGDPSGSDQQSDQREVVGARAAAGHVAGSWPTVSGRSGRT
ncbi:DUF881 domain-containing protein [Cellulomonas timonensis]|uniref:DUF881 domain-containing protein n=1 Tax=Cellulomonas timonensis TaxID=1689271 RepID=UPI0008335D5C|nr:DUF881 domain-containing protein [Cellulomonas timonensis]